MDVNSEKKFIDIVKIEFKTKDSDFVDSEHYEKLISHTMKCLESSVNSKKIPCFTLWRGKIFFTSIHTVHLSMFVRNPSIKSYSV